MTLLSSGSEWVDPEDPTVIAETELLGAAASIEAAAKKLEQLKPRAKPKVDTHPCFSVLYSEALCVNNSVHQHTCVKSLPPGLRVLECAVGWCEGLPLLEECCKVLQA